MVQEKAGLHGAPACSPWKSTTYQTAALIDRGLEDYMLETAMLKVFTTEALWTNRQRHVPDLRRQGVLHRRTLRTHAAQRRINQIGEGANDVLRGFIALVGMRDPAEELRTVRDSLYHPWRARGVLGRFTAGFLPRLLRRPRLPVHRAI